MAYEEDVSSGWTEVTLAADEIWQCRGGTILVTVGAPNSRNQGIELDGDTGQGIRIASGKTINYRRINDGNAVLAREAFE